MKHGPYILLLVSALALGCDDPPESDDAGVEPARVRPRFEPTADPMDMGAIPFPDDLYLDANGRVALGTLPSEEQAFPPEFPETLRTALGDLDGFSVTAPVFFYFPPSSLEPGSLPATAAEAVREDSPVFLVDADPSSPEAFRRLPVQVVWNAELGLLVMRPAGGHPLMPGRRYAAVVTSGVLDDRGDPIGPSELFRRVRDATARPEDPLLGEAYDQYTPVLSTLSGNGVPRETVAALAVFTVQTVRPDLADARAQIWEAGPPTVELVASFEAGPDLDALLGRPTEPVGGLDVEGGVSHDHVGWLIHGAFGSPWFASGEPRVHGRFRYDAEGRLVSDFSERVPFTLTVPAGATASVPLVVFCHGIGSERSTMLAVADVLAESGYATLAIDLPFHGMRASGSVVDVRHNYGAGTEPDGFGDRVGNEIYLDYLGVQDEDGPLAAFHPAYVRDILRQSVIDLMSAVRVARDGDWTAVRALPGMERFEIAPDPMAFVGISLGGIVGTVFVASEPEIGVALLNVTGGDLTRLVERSAGFGPVFLPILLPRVGVDPGGLDYEAYPPSFHPEMAIVQTLLDRGDSMSFASALRQQPRDVLFQMARYDETVPNSATEALARAARATILDADPSFADLPRGDTPASENAEVDGERVTRGLYTFGEATHGLLTRRAGERRIVAPPEPPFESMSPVPVANPVDSALGQMVHFFDSWRGGAAEIIAAP